MIDRISENEKNMMRSYIKDYSEGGLSAPIEHILEPWANNKQYLSKMFPESLILEKEISYEKGEDEILDNISDELTNNWADTEIRDFVRNWKDTFYPSWGYPDDDLEARQRREMLWAIYNLIDGDKLYTGRWDRDTIEIELPEMEKAIKIQNGAHIMKYIRKFAEIYKIEP